MAVTIPASIGLLLVSIVVWVVTDFAAKGKIARNIAAGIRIAATLSSDEAWLAGHQAALPLAKWTGIIGSALSFIILFAGGFTEILPTLPIVVLCSLSYATFILSVIIMAWMAHRAARSTQ